MEREDSSEDLMEQLRKAAEAEAKQQFSCDPDSPNWVASLPKNKTVVGTLSEVIEAIQQSFTLKPDQVRKRALKKGYVEGGSKQFPDWIIQWNPEVVEVFRSQSEINF
ncbi:MAG TPA: hypothetical protein V6D10_15795 [Trichocoleus sp.]